MEATQQQPLPEGKGVDVTELLVERLDAGRTFYFEPQSTQAIHQAIQGCLIAIAKRRLNNRSDYVAIAKIKDDLQARSVMGKKKYGETLHTFNGRDANLDLYQELLDAYKYSGQQLEEESCSRSI